MATLPDGREVPDHYSDIGVLAPGGGTRGITRAGQLEQIRQHTASMSLPTRILGAALGAAETIVPAVGGPKQTLRQAAKAARDWIVQGPVEAFQQGQQTFENAQAGDPHAQGQALAMVAATRAGLESAQGRTGTLPHPLAETPPLEWSAAAPGVIDAQAARAAGRFSESASAAADATYQQMIERRAQRLAPPGYNGPQRRAIDVVQGLADLARKRQAELQASAAKYAQHTAETILPNILKE